MNARLITLEGGEGAGKSTVLAGVYEHLQKRGIDVLITREPGGTRLGEAVRCLVLDPEQGDLCAESELLLMFAARAQLVREVICPALSSGVWVLADRYIDASYAYQGGGRGQPAERISELERWAAVGIKPDLTVLLDLPVPVGRRRVLQRNTQGDPAGPDRDRIERENDAFFDRVRAVYTARARAEPERFRVIDASRSPDRVLADASSAVDELIVRCETRP
ncbi:MAG: dTMP kinase [Rhodanobacteraceae bacterium]